MPVSPPSAPSGATASQVAKDVTLYGGIVVALFSVLANVPAFRSVFAASGSVQAVVDAVISVVTALFSVKGQKATAAAVASVKKSA